MRMGFYSSLLFVLAQ
uniref:Uncharacterized protein n=1 Tax=Anguilla anguilla TaxID=7936 RepID=A0A0E9XEJ6_ANGAN